MSGSDSVLQPESSPRGDKPSDDRQTLRAVVRAKAGDQEAIRYLYCRYADNVHGYVRSIVRDHHDAEDVTQDVFAKLKGSIAKYEPRQVDHPPVVSSDVRLWRSVRSRSSRRSGLPRRTQLRR